MLPEQAVLVSSDGAREPARRYTATYVKLESYARNLRRLGFEDEDLAGEGSDRLVDAMVASGGIDAATERVVEHLEAGADHVAIRVLTEDPKRLPFPELDELAAALGL